MLDDRKLKVLYAIINSYVDSAEPIGSRTISKNYDLGVSSATIRNEMSDLEDLGYLSKPHTSAGRIPSDKGYRLYVNELLKLKNSLEDELTNEKIITQMLSSSGQINELIENSARLLSAMTNYTSIVASPKMKEIKVDRLQFVAVENVGVLILVVCNNGVLRNTLYKTDYADVDDLNIIANYLNKALDGLLVEEMIEVLNSEIPKELMELSSLYSGLIPHLKELLEELIEIEIYYDGITNIFNYPEYRDVDKAKEFMDFIENKELLLDIILKNSTSKDMDIIIGNENIYSPIKDISMITATYYIDGKTIGKVGLVGPTRMDYQNLINTVQVFSDNISKVMNIYLNK